MGTWLYFIYNIATINYKCRLTAKFGPSCIMLASTYVLDSYAGMGHYHTAGSDVRSLSVKTQNDDSPVTNANAWPVGMMVTMR